MGKFRDFLIREDVGLAELGPRIDKLFHSQEFGNQLAGAIVSDDWNGQEISPGIGPEQHSLFLPSTDITIPSVERTGRITCLMLHKNPIYIRLSDGTECQFTYDEYKRIEGIPELGKTMTVIFQRSPQDFSRQHSKIDKAMVVG